MKKAEESQAEGNKAGQLLSENDENAFVKRIIELTHQWVSTSVAAIWDTAEEIRGQVVSSINNICVQLMMSQLKN